MYIYRVLALEKNHNSSKVSGFNNMFRFHSQFSLSPENTLISILLLEILTDYIKSPPSEHLPIMEKGFKIIFDNQNNNAAVLMV